MQWCNSHCVRKECQSPESPENPSGWASCSEKAGNGGIGGMWLDEWAVGTLGEELVERREIIPIPGW